MTGTESSLQYGDHPGHLADHLSPEAAAAKPAPRSSSDQTTCVQICHKKSNSAGLTRDVAVQVDGVGVPSLSSNLAESYNQMGQMDPNWVELPLRVIRIPSSMCPVHLPDQNLLGGLTLSCETMAVSNCWQVFPSSDRASAGSTSTLVEVSPPVEFPGYSPLNYPRLTYRKRLEAIFDFIAWVCMVMICGFILFYQARGFEY